MSQVKKVMWTQLVKFVLGLVVFSFGVYLGVVANIGLAPWDAFSMGISYATGVPFGVAHTIISCIILVATLLMREKIGLGTAIDALLMGNIVDLFLRLEVVPVQTSPLRGAIVMTVGLFFVYFGQYFCMSAAHGCGPRDAFLVGVGRRLPRFPIGVVNMLILGSVLCIGWLLGAPIGIGTLIGTFGASAVMQLVFRVMKFEPRKVEHQGLFEATRQLLGKAAE